MRQVLVNPPVAITSASNQHVVHLKSTQYVSCIPVKLRGGKQLL